LEDSGGFSDERRAHEIRKRTDHLDGSRRAAPLAHFFDHAIDHPGQQHEPPLRHGLGEANNAINVRTVDHMNNTAERKDMQGVLERHHVKQRSPGHETIPRCQRRVDAPEQKSCYFRAVADERGFRSAGRAAREQNDKPSSGSAIGVGASEAAGASSAS
jgi:hypothetical protein